MKSRGIVIEIKENRAIIRFIKESACGGNCASCGGCKSKPIEIEIENSLDAKVSEHEYIQSFEYKNKENVLVGKEGNENTFTINHLQVFEMEFTEEQKRK